MTTLKRELPPLNALVTFEAAARLQGFTRAAAELGVTQAAVSRQIQRLEQQLGTILFRRGHRQLELTASGRRLREAVDSGLNEIALGVRRVRLSAAEPPVSIAATISFSTYWLMPRLHAFRQANPDTDIRILAEDRDLDPGSDDVDIVVRFGEETQVPGREPYSMGRERIVPVCTPAYMEAHPELREASPEDLVDAELLHLDPEHWNHLLHGAVIDWPVWFQHHGVKLDRGLRGIRLNNYVMLMDAVFAGRGIALGWRPVIDDLIESGELVRIVDAELVTPRSYWAIIGARQENAEATRRVFEWLTAQVQAKDND